MTDRAAERAVSTAISYVLMLAIASLLVVGLLISGGDFVGNERERVVETELEVIGQQLAADITAADRMVEAAKTDTSSSDIVVNVSQQRPRSVTGSTYDVTLVAQQDPYLELASVRPDVSVTVELSNSTDLGASRADGGDIKVAYESDELVIRNE